MPVSEISKKIISVLESSSVSEVIVKLLENNLSRLVVVKKGKPVGIITEKDVGLFLLSDKNERGLDNIPVTKIMKPISFVEESVSIQEAAKTMIEKGISSLGISSNKQLNGICTKTDLVKYYLDKISEEDKVVEYMTHDYVHTYTAAPLFKVVRKMLERKVSRVIVKDQNENPVGVISFRDLFRIAIELGSDGGDLRHSISGQTRKGFLSEEGFGDSSLARDVMTRESSRLNLIRVCTPRAS